MMEDQEESKQQELGLNEFGLGFSAPSQSKSNHQNESEESSDSEYDNAVSKIYFNLTYSYLFIV